MEDDSGLDELLASLASWSGDERAVEAAESRARGRWLSQQAGEAATMAGVLLDLAEHRAEVLIATDGRVHRGRLRAVGADAALLEHDPGGVTLIALDAIRTFEPAPAHRQLASSGSRSTSARWSLASVLDALAAERTDVSVELRGGNVVTGSLHGVGADVLAVRVEGRPARRLHIPLRAVASCRL
jgi:hypothetical protein